jgi:ribonuclease M5
MSIATAVVFDKHRPYHFFPKVCDLKRTHESKNRGRRFCSNDHDHKGDRKRNHEEHGENGEENGAGLDILVVVEGVNDAKVVRRALDISQAKAVFAIKDPFFDKRSNTWKIQPDIVKKVAADAGWVDDDSSNSNNSNRCEIVILTDPDVAGRHMRANFIKYLPDAKHAFVSRYRARCKKKTKWHDVTDCGVEFATDGMIRQAIKNARKPNNNKENEWMMMSDIEAKGLKGLGASRIRHVLGNVLGIGECDARQIHRQLNMWFTRDEFHEAMEVSKDLISSGVADEIDFHTTATSDDFGFDPNAYIAPGKAPLGFE